MGELRDRTLKWTPRSLPRQQLTFAGGKLYTEHRSQVIALDPAGKQEPRRYGVEGSHRLVALADGSLFGVGVSSTFVLRPTAKQAESVRSVVLLPQEVLFGNAGILGQFDSFDPIAGRWSSYSFNSTPGVSPVWLPETAYEQPELEQGLCTQLIDGTYACFAGDRLWHRLTRSRAKLIGPCPPGAPVWRVLPGPRADQVWIARQDATLEKWWIVHPPKRLASLDLPWTPLDIALRGEHVAVVRIIQNRAQPKRLTLVVLDTRGSTRFEQPLLSGADDEPNAAESDIHEAEVAIDPRRPWLGLRTSGGTRVVDLDTGETLVQVQ